MPDEEDRSALLLALTTEHFALQSAASSTIAESGTRATVFISALSSALVALGFASTRPEVLVAFTATVLPVVFLLGAFTTTRLVDTTVENVDFQRRIEAIRGYYRTLSPDAARYLPVTGFEASRRQRRLSRAGVLRTIGTMVTAVNAALGGATAALLVLLVARVPVLAGITVGLAVGIVLLAAGLVYQDRRIRPAMTSRGVDDDLPGQRS